MKVTRQGKEFIPIIITLETEEEAQFLFQLMECPTNQIEDLLKSNHFDPPMLDREFHLKLSGVYPLDC